MASSTPHRDVISTVPPNLTIGATTPSGINRTVQKNEVDHGFYREYHKWLLEDLPKFSPAFHIVTGFILGFTAGWGTITVGRMAAFFGGVLMVALVFARESGCLQMDFLELRQQVLESAQILQTESRRQNARKTNQLLWEFAQANGLLCSCWACGFCFGLSYG